MKFYGKTIPTDKINFVMNIVSFILGIIFFVRMQFKMNEKSQAVNFNSERDSLLIIESRVNTQLKEIKIIQERIGKSISQNQTLLAKQNKEVAAKRQRVFSQLHVEWAKLDPQDRDAYVNKIMSNLKQKNK